MNEFIDKLIERLEEEKQRLRKLRNNTVTLTDHEVCAIEEGAFNFCKKTVNQLAEEYSADTPQKSAGGWIPLLKQKPEYGQYVLASIPPKVDINGGHPVVIMEFREDNEPLFCRFVSAWMPLPEPYQPKGA